MFTTAYSYIPVLRVPHVIKLNQRSYLCLPLAGHLVLKDFWPYSDEYLNPSGGGGALRYMRVFWGFCAGVHDSLVGIWTW